VWMRERGGGPEDPLFPTRQGARLTRNGVRSVVARHASSAARRCLSLGSKHVTPHSLRHTCAMELLRAGVDSAVIALLLGHERMETTDRIYLHGDLSIKERALGRTTPPNSKPGRYRPPDRLVAFLQSL
jgi:integrase/recombinase XerD